jgi:hypothetical protein
MFSNALKECQNSTLECIRIFYVGLNDAFEEEIWTREVIPILEFNRVRRCFQENRGCLSHGERLGQALDIAQDTDNHHLRFWVVRNNVCNFLCSVLGK